VAGVVVGGTVVGPGGAAVADPGDDELGGEAPGIPKDAPVNDVNDGYLGAVDVAAVGMVIGIAGVDVKAGAANVVYGGSRVFVDVDSSAVAVVVAEEVGEVRDGLDVNKLEAAVAGCSSLLVLWRAKWRTPPSRRSAMPLGILKPLCFELRALSTTW